jgi:cell fate (sporulation/competence/biofilm development) regulator YlbF (YheA/YmcA/DUF963 family)
VTTQWAAFHGASANPANFAPFQRFRMASLYLPLNSHPGTAGYSGLKANIVLSVTIECYYKLYGTFREAGGLWMNTIDMAREFAKSLANCPEYLNYKNAKENLERHEAAQMMFNDFRRKQMELERRKMNGEQYLEMAEGELRKLSEVVNLNLFVRDYLMAEYQFTKLMMEIQQLLANAVEVKLPTGN